MWRFLSAVCVVLVGVQLGSWAGVARADSIEISDRVWGHFQEYLVTIGSAKPGAFAVSRDGGSSYYVYCRDVRCRSGTTYSHEAVTRCESMTGQDCVVFALWRDIKVAYTQAPKTAPLVSANPQPAAVVTPEPEEPPFESPLSDGTIVLSRKVAKQLDGYLAALNAHGMIGFFYVAPNGRTAGDFVCNSATDITASDCPKKPATAYATPKPDRQKIQERAREACEGGQSADCVLLYASDGRRADYRIVE